ncbi:LysE family transporter [uncultured Ferrimonas sp.]|uniref:LysE family translocator n=1 Tax=uncultured Ferrimonas sp. TaxID=432640 RepID=UPI002634F181|nr:LysE family transporter [uncultured Ferrimonas sp.]
MINEFSILATLALVHLAALASPGPDFALVVQAASRHGRQAGLAIAFGISLAILLHAMFAISGVSLLIQQAPLLGVALKVAGGGYLLYLGVSALSSLPARLRQPTGHPLASNGASLSIKQATIKGFITNLLNPKALVFFLSLITSLVPVQMSVGGKGAAIGILWGLSFVWFAALSYLLTGAKMQQKLQRLTVWIDALCGGLFSLVGAGILLSVALTLLG